MTKLAEPVICHSDEIGEVEFMPTIVQIEWERPPSWDKHEFWFPYWVRVRGKEKYGQFAPMIGENALLQLLRKGIERDFFSREFLLELAQSARAKLNEEKS